MCLIVLSFCSDFKRLHKLSDLEGCSELCDLQRKRNFNCSHGLIACDVCGYVYDGSAQCMHPSQFDAGDHTDTDINDGMTDYETDSQDKS